MSIEISDRLLKKSGISEQEILLRIAIEFFKEERLTLAAAAKFAGIHQMEFQKELAKRKIPIHYGIEEFEQDMETLKTLKF